MPASSRRRRGARERRGRQEVPLPWLELTGLLLIALKISVTVLAIDLAAVQAFALAKSAAGRPITYALLVVVLFQIARKRDELRPSRVHIALAAFVLFAGIATGLAVHPPTSLFGADGRYLGLTSILDGALLALAVNVFVRATGDLRVIVAAILAPAVPALIVGLGQILHADVLQLDLGITSTIGNPGAYGGYLVIVESVAVGTLVSSWPALRPWQRAAMLALVLLVAFEAVSTGSRTATLALAVALPAPFIIILARGRIRSAVTDLRLIGAVAVVALVATLLLTLTPTGGRLAALASGSDTSAVERRVIYQASATIIGEHPFVGVGPDGFVTGYLPARPPEAIGSTVVQRRADSAHSWFVHQAVGTGFAGLALILSAVALGLWHAWRRTSTGDPAARLGLVMMLAFLAQGAFSIPHLATDWSFWVAMGLLARPLIAPEPTTSAVHPRDRTMVTRAIAAGAVAVALALAPLSLRPLVASERSRTSDALLPDNARAAESAALSATREDPGRADHWNRLGLARAALAMPTAADVFMRASDAAPYEPTYAINAVKELLRSGAPTSRQVEQAVRYADRAVIADGRSPEAHFVRGHALLASGRLLEATSEAERAVEWARRARSPSEVVSAYALQASIAQAARDIDLAVTNLRTAIAEAERAGQPQRTVRIDLVRTLLLAGRSDEAIREAVWLREHVLDDPEVRGLLEQLPRAP